MPEHWIRLRGAWEWQDPSRDAEARRYVTLPLEWSAGQETAVRLVRLVRRFNRPPIDPGRESLSLRMENVPGLLAVRLNAHTVDVPLDATLTLDLGSLGPLAAKNVLILEVDPTRATRAGAVWGQIALVVVATPEKDEPGPGRVGP